MKKVPCPTLNVVLFWDSFSSPKKLHVLPGKTEIPGLSTDNADFFVRYAFVIFRLGFLRAPRSVEEVLSKKNQTVFIFTQKVTFCPLQASDCHAKKILGL